MENFQGGLQSLAELYDNSLRIFYLEGNSYSLIHSITDLQKIIDQILEETKSIYPKDINISAYKATVTSNIFRIDISNFFSEKIRGNGFNRYPNISGTHLNKADLLILRQSGGIEETVLNHVYQVKVSVHDIRGFSTPYQFLEQLTKHLATTNAGVISSFPKILISTPGDHNWTLSPDSWKILMNHRKEFYRWIDSTVFNPAKRKLASKIPHSVITRVIHRYTEEIEKRKIIKDQTIGHGLSYSKFKTLFINSINPRSIDFAEEIIEEEFSKVNLSKPKLSSILKNLDLITPSEHFHPLYKSLSQSSVQPHLLAREIRLALISEKIKVIDPYKIEIAICETFSLPLPFNLGDLNWINEYSEDPQHQHLMIKFSWINGVPQYFIREGNKELVEPQKEYRHFRLQHPVVAASPSQL